MADELAPWFLGAYAENDDFFEKAVLELFRDHVFWRRNFHPEDPPPITTQEQHQPAFLDALARTRHELHQLTAQLKRSVPFFHPRYLGHMVSDLLLPGLLAQLTTTLYNPNNVVTNTAPVTVRLELEVGKQLARMLGFDARALGHLTSGGTLANDEGLWLARAVKLFPLAARDACEVVGRFPVAELKADDVELLSWNTERTLALLDALTKDDEVLSAASALRVEQLGLAQFAAKHPAVLDLAVLAPGTAHYSWTKAMKLLGLGARQLLEVPTVEARLDAAALEELLETRAKRRLPTLAVVGVYGTTEFGTLDPIHELAALRGEHGFWLHVDAAWGGYLPSLFRDASGALRPREEVAREFKYFPSERVHRATAALGEADSITVDPHKLGFVPFGAGAFLARDARVFRFAQQDAAYVFDRDSAELQLGRFSLEGSRPGGPAAACYVNHRVLPLDSANFGRLIARSVTTCEALYERFHALAKRVSALAVCIPFEPDCNLVCLAFNRRGNRSLRAANAFARTVYEQMAVHPELPVQSSRFIGSSTTVELSHLGAAELARLSGELDLELQQADDTGLFMLRHTLMNPWLMSPAASAPTHLDEYVDFLERLLTRP